MTSDTCPCCEAKRAAELVAREWERQANQWKRVAEERRAELATLIEDARAQGRELLTLRTDRDVLMSELGEAIQGLMVKEGL